MFSLIIMHKEEIIEEHFFDSPYNKKRLSLKEEIEDFDEIDEED